MKRIVFVLLATSILSPGVEAASWKCSGPRKVISVRYNPIDSYAYIQFDGSRYAGAHPITKVGNNKITGTTHDGTTFSCVR